MKKLFSCKLLLSLVIILTVKSFPQIKHTPEFFGIFLDTPKELIELSNPITNNVSAKGGMATCLLQGIWNPQRIWLDGNPTIILYGDEYLPSETSLYKSSVVISEYNNRGTIVFSEIKLKTGPLTGLPAKAYKMICSEELEEGDYLLKYQNKFYPLLLSKMRSSNPIVDSFYDIGFNGKGNIYLTTDNGFYEKENGEWKFVEKRGMKITKIFDSYNTDGSFYFFEGNRKNQIGFSPDGGKTFNYSTMDDFIKTFIMREEIITGVVNCKRAPSVYYFYGKGISNAMGVQSGFVVCNDKTQNFTTFEELWVSPATWLLIHPGGCSTSFVGTTKTEYYTTDWGQNWEEIEDNKFPEEYGKIDFAGVGPALTDDFYQARDAIFTFDEATNKYEKTNWQYGKVNSYLWDSTSFLIASDLGLYESTDGGKNWEKRSETFKDPKVIKIISDLKNNNKIYALTKSVLYLSTDRGKNWKVE